MTLEQQQEYFEKKVDVLRSILFSKGNDYANKDRLSNFKLAGSICGLSPEQNCLSLIATKVARLGVLLNSDSPASNESIEDSIDDLINYGLLLSMIREEKCVRKSGSGVHIPTASRNELEKIYLENLENQERAMKLDVLNNLKQKSKGEI